MKKTIKEIWGLPSAIELDVGDAPPAQHAMLQKQHYTPRQDVISDMTLFWTKERRSAMLVGPKGSGKTSVVEQWHARLNLPLLVMGCHRKTGEEHFFGQFLPTEAGGLRWHDGPIMLAAKNGWSVLINEFNAAPDDITIMVNDVAQQGSVIVNPLTGESIHARRGFRIYATINPSGPSGVLYQSRNSLDPSTRERFFWIEVGYPNEDDEVNIVFDVWKHCSSLSSEDQMRNFARQQVLIANLVRGSSVGVSSQPDAITETLSTRVLCDWAEYWATLYRKESAAHLALRRALTAGSPPEAARAIHGLVTQVLGVKDPYHKDIGEEATAAAA